MTKFKMARISGWLGFTIILSLVVSSLSSCDKKKSVRPSFSQSGQTTVDQGGSEASGAGAKTIDAPKDSSLDLCKKVDQACDAVGPRMFCELRSFPGYVVNDDHRPYAYANGECESKRLVLAEACSRGWDIKTLDSIQCQPDASNGECPSQETICTAEFEPHSCTAKKYAGVAIDQDNPLIGWGANYCHANLALDDAACARNKNPRSLAEKSCTPLESFTGDCPQSKSACQVVADGKFECATQLKDDAGKIMTNLVGSGGSECAARARLNQKVCIQGKAPSEVAASVVCRKI